MNFRIWSGMVVMALGAPLAFAQQDFSKIVVESSKVADGVYMLTGAGGNIGVSIGEDGVIIIDDEFQEMTPRIQDALAKLSPKPVRFVINTHWHFDHTGGNESLARRAPSLLLTTTCGGG